MYIDGNGRVGIGITNPPNALLHLHKIASGQEVRLQSTDGCTTSSSIRGLAIGKSTDNRSFIFNFENTALFFATNAVERMRIANNGSVGIQDPTTSYAIPNNYMASGSLTIGNIGQNYGGGNLWNTSTAGLLLECFDTTEIAVHDSGAAIHSFMYYSGGIFQIGRDMGYNAGNVNIKGWLAVDRFISTSTQIISGTYILSQSGAVYARNGFDTLLYADSGQMSVNFGNIGNGSTPAYLKIGAYSGATYIESSQQRNIIFKIYVGVLTGTAPTWSFNTLYNCFNANNSTTWNQVSDQRIKENIIKADLKTCYDNVKNINLYRFNYIEGFDF
jgi:hypothetical protein